MKKKEGRPIKGLNRKTIKISIRIEPSQKEFLIDKFGKISEGIDALLKEAMLTKK